LIKPYQYQKKESFVNRTDDIPGLFQKKLIRNPRTVQHIDPSLRTADIARAQPRINLF
jgi:hypothetical protein